MLMTEIRREGVGEVEKLGESILALAAQAKELLGYSVLEKITGSVNVAELTTLQTALKELEIEILRPMDVVRYQKEQMIAQTLAGLAEWQKDVTGKEKLAAWDRYSGPSWTQTKIAEYRQPVPEYVLSKAVQIKQRVPECEILVEGLESHPDPFLLVTMPGAGKYDPPKEAYYVEVWAEPKFDGRLEESGIPF